MSTRIIGMRKRRKPTKKLLLNLIYFVILFTMILLPAPLWAEWKVDLSRRQKTVREAEMRAEPMNASQNEKSFFDVISGGGSGLSQQIAIFQSEQGFVPPVLRLKKDLRYTIYIVNLNEKEKNVSFVLDGFSKYIGTEYAKPKSFEIEPKREGVYNFESPETKATGQIIIVSSGGGSST